MNKKEIYNISFDSAREQEEMVRKYLLEKADIVRYTNYPNEWALGILVIIPFPIYKNCRGKEFQKSLQEFKADFIKKETNNMLYNGVPQENHLVDHYYYRLSDRMKKFINEITLLSNPLGFADPTFYKENKIICSIISHEPVFVFILDDSERQELNQKGIIFD